MKGDRLPQQVLKRLEQMDYIRPGQTICCALSGGADSVCLLRCLLELQETLAITVKAVHVNHQLRGAESDRDQQFCQALCREWNVPIQLFSVDVRAAAAREKCSVELAARQCRYRAFSQVEADWIATAHTASDNLETLLHRLTRGSSLHGLTATPPINGRFLRPLLAVTRQEVEDYLAELEQPYVTDSTNLTDDYTRNRIRHRIVPELKQLNPSVERTVSHTIASLCREDDYMTRQAKAAYAKCAGGYHTLTGLERLHPALQMRCVAMLLEECGLHYDAPLLERLYDLVQTGGKWNLTGNVYARAERGMLSITTDAPPPQPLQEQLLLKIGENQLFPGYVLTAAVIPRECLEKDENIHEKSTNFLLDYDKIKGDIFLRPRQYGEKLQLSGRTFTSSLKKLIQEKVPRSRRSTLHLLADGEGTIYAEFIGIAQRVCPDEETRRLLKISVRTCGALP